jgi:hypothetical protein
MKRYLAWSYSYYPSSAQDSFVGAFDTVEEALHAAIGKGGGFWEILDTFGSVWMTLAEGAKR